MTSSSRPSPSPSRSRVRSPSILEQVVSHSSSLYDRLGGVYSITTVIDDFIDRIMIDSRLNANPRVAEAHHRVSPAGFKYHRGEVHRGEHEPILARDLFEAAQARRAANAVARQLRLRGSAAPLTSRLFGDRGNRMSPTHANKRGVRYRYYVSHALLQNQRAEAGSVARIPAPRRSRTVVFDGRACDAIAPGIAW